MSRSERSSLRDRQGMPGLENGGIAPPGMPVVVGDDSQGKENKELAMVDASGNLIVVPIDQLRHAQDGGLFSFSNGAEGATGVRIA